MVVERKEEIRELWEIVSDYTQIVDAPEGFFERDQHLPVPSITHQLAVVEFYEAIAYSILSRFTNAVSRQEALKKFEETARERLDYEIVECGLILTGDPALTSQNLERMTIREIYSLGLTLERCLNPDMYCPEEEKEILDGIKMATTLASYAVAQFTPLIRSNPAKSILTTMLDNYRRYIDDSDYVGSEREKDELLAKIKIAYKQIDRIFVNT